MRRALRVGDRGFMAAFMKAARAYDKRVNRSKRAARAEMVRLGIYTKTGRLTKNYGG